MTTTTTEVGEHHSLPWKLYHGETSFDFVGHRNRWFAISGAIILVGLLALGFKGLNFGIDFRGGTNWEVPAQGVSVESARNAVGAAGVNGATVQTVKSNSKTYIRVQANVSPNDVAKVTHALAVVTKNPDGSVSVNSVGPSWGRDISRKAERALVAFFIAVFIFIALRFQWKMALAAIIAVIHDLAITVGIYAIFGFDVTPATVIAILTILGYSLYDTVVVFDKVDENTKGLAASGRMTYSDMVNLSMNQVLMRSLNTSLVAILPIASVLVVGDLFLGATTLKEFGLALFVGLITGAYSSIFIAAPILAMLKEREPRYVTIRQRLESRGTAGAVLTPRAAAEMAGAGARSARTTGRSATAVLDDGAYEGEPADGGAEGDLTPAASTVLRPGGGQAPRTAAAARPPAAANRNRPGSSRAAPRGRKKGGKRR
ncbi:MAG: protein translocase subunit SecF [Acidimicrobiales bacterium]